jgi:dipeptidyl aminopeptidase/acylaminoacyl peptidase
VNKKNQTKHIMQRVNLIAIIFLIALQSSAQTTIDNLLSPAFPTNLIASADGSTIAWVFNNKGSRNIFVANGNNFSNVKQLTTYTGDDGVEINSLAFTPDGNQIVFVRGNTNNSQGYAANPALLQTDVSRNIFIINKDGNGLHKLATGFYPKISPDGKTLAYLNGGQVYTTSITDTTIKPQQLFKTRISQASIRWNNDGSKLAFTSNRGNHTFIGIYDFTTKSISFPDASADHDQDPVWSADGNWLTYIRTPNVRADFPFTPNRAGEPWSIRLLNVQTSEAKEIWKADAGKGSVFVDDLPVADNKLLWAASNQLVFPWEKDGWLHLYSLDIEKKTTKLLTPGNGEVENITLSPDKQTVYYTCNITDINRRHIWKVNVSDAKAELLTKGNNIEWSPVVTAAGVALLRSSAKKPAWPAYYSNGTVTDIAAEFFPKDFYTGLVQPQQISIKATDGIEAPAQIFLPPNYEKSKQYPAMIFLHGGSRRQMLLGFNYGQYYSNAYALNQFFAHKGYIVIALNFRSGIGYGLDFREADNYGISGASEVKDVIGAGEYLKSRTDVDAKRIGLWGGSYGGYLTAHGLARRSDLFAAGVDIHGVHNWNDEVPTFASNYDSLKYAAIGKLAYQSSPVNFISGWKSPVLFIHGDDDRNVPFSETVNIIEALRPRKVYFEQLVFPDEVHSFLLHRNWVKAYEACFDFMERKMK